MVLQVYGGRHVTPIVAADKQEAEVVTKTTIIVNINIIIIAVVDRCILVINFINVIALRSCYLMVYN